MDALFIGLEVAMILIVTNEFDPTSDYVIEELNRRGASFERLNTEDFPMKVRCTIDINSSVLTGNIDLGSDRNMSLSDIDSVYYRRPKRFEIDPQLSFGEAREFALSESRAAIGGLWMALPCLWVNHPHRIRAAEFKIYQLRIAAELGFRTPRTLITNDPEEIRDFYEAHDRNVVAKPLRSGMIQYDDEALLIYTTPLRDDHLDLVEAVKYAPCLFQEYIPKKVEIRATVVGSRVFAAEIHSQSSERTKDDWRRYDLDNTPHVPRALPAQIDEQCVNMVRRLGLNFGAIDLIITPDDEYVFLEINPNGQWGWIEELTNLPICSAIADLLTGSM